MKSVFNLNFCRTEKGKVEVFDWIEEKSITLFSFLNEDVGFNQISNDYGIQIINIKKCVGNLILVQMRNGFLFICELIFDLEGGVKKFISIKIKLVINTEVETFTKFITYSDIDLDKDYFSIMCSSNKDDELTIYNLKKDNNDENTFDTFNICDKKLIYIGDKKLENSKVQVDLNDSNDDDLELDSKKSNGLISVISTEEDISFIVIAQESSRLIILDKQSLSILTSIKLTEDVKTVLSIKIAQDQNDKKTFYLFIGLYHVEMLILKYNITTSSLAIDQTVKDTCSPQKPGIPTIDYISFLKSDALFSDSKKTNLIVTGSYDFRFRLYELYPILNTNMENSLSLNYLGFSHIQNNCIIHQVKFYEDKDTNNLYLFVISDQKILLIFNIL